MLIASLLVSCDPFKDDVIPDEKVVTVNRSATDYYLVENSSAIIDKTAVVKSSFAKISIEVAQQPTRGTVAAIGDVFLKYTPSAELRESVYSNRLVTDEFKLVFKHDEKILSTETITAHLGWRADYFPCSLYAVGDTVSTTQGISVPIRAGFNDRICNINMSDVQTSIAFDPAHGKVVVRGDTIIYKPDAGFYGVDEMIYRISAPLEPRSPAGDSLLVSFGLVAITVRE